MDRLRILTLNIWNRQGPWEARLALIRNGLAALRPDVVGLQEVLRLEGAGPDQAEAIADGLGYEIRYASTWDVGAGMQFGNAILSRFPIVEHDAWPLPVVEGNEGRGLLYALVEAPCGRVPVFVTHLSWKLHHGAMRLRQIERIADRMRERAPTTGFPPILMGDMNAEPDADEMRFLRGLTPINGRTVYLADCWHCCRDEPGHTYARSNSYAARTHEPSRRIDYIYVRGPDRQFRGEPLAARVVFDESRDGVFPSDHYGVYAEIQAAPRAHDPI